MGISEGHIDHYFGKLKINFSFCQLVNWCFTECTFRQAHKSELIALPHFVYEVSWLLLVMILIWIFSQDPQYFNI